MSPTRDQLEPKCRCRFNTPRPGFSPTCPVEEHRVAAEDAIESRISEARGEVRRDLRGRHDYGDPEEAEYERESWRLVAETERLIRRMKQNRGVPAAERYEVKTDKGDA